MSSLAIIDYGMANLRSVQKAFEHVGHSADIINQPEQIARYDRIVLPGVGAFKDAIATLKQGGFADPIRQHIAADKPFLGICLGLQMLFDVGYEDGEHAGLGIIKGECIRFDVDQNCKLKVPHMGWNQLEIRQPHRVLTGLENGSAVYFVHSYHVQPADENVIATRTEYGRKFVSSIARGNLFATQFHPEKSQKVGLQILKNFAHM